MYTGKFGDFPDITCQHSVVKIAFITDPIVIPVKNHPSIPGQYYVSVPIGPPGKAVTFAMSIQTNLADILVFDKNCQGCQPSKAQYSYSYNTAIYQCNAHDPYSPCTTCGKNHTCISSLKRINQYGECVAYGDNMQFGSQTPQVFFGSIIRAFPGATLVPEGLDGVLGIGYDSLKSVFIQPLTNLGNTLGINSTSYSLCLKSGGSITFNHQFNAGEVQWLISGGWPVLGCLQGIKINGQTLLGTYSSTNNAFCKQFPGSTTITVDTSTRALSLSYEQWIGFQQILGDMCNTTDLVGVCTTILGHSLFDGTCFEMNDEQITQFPTLEIMFVPPVIKLNLEPQHYLMPSRSDSTKYCLAVNGEGGTTGNILFGTAFTQAFHIAINQATGSVGFAPTSTCPKIAH